MKNYTFLFLMILLFGCQKDDIEVSFLDSLIGKWVPTESVSNDGTRYVGLFTSNSIFGAYKESFVSEKRGEFAPMNWFSESDFTTHPDEKGTILYDKKNKIIEFKTNDIGSVKFTIIESTSNSLWLSIQPGDKIKLEKK